MHTLPKTSICLQGVSYSERAQVALGIPTLYQLSDMIESGCIVALKLLVHAQAGLLWCCGAAAVDLPAVPFHIAGLVRSEGEEVGLLTYMISYQCPRR